MNLKSTFQNPFAVVREFDKKQYLSTKKQHQVMEDASKGSNYKRPSNPNLFI